MTKLSAAIQFSLQCHSCTFFRILWWIKSKKKQTEFI